MNRTILHLDLDAFFCAVEELTNPDLRGKAFAVGGNAESRGVVASCSYPARVFGVRSAMPMRKAQLLCPDLIVVRSSFSEYGHLSKKVMAILEDTTPLVEKLSIDEAFLDVTGIQAMPHEIARGLQSRINAELALPSSLGVATSKLIAKTANNIGKATATKGEYPRAITVIPAGEEARFMAPLAIRELWGVGPKTAESLLKLGLVTIGDIATYPESELVRRFGKHGADIKRRAQGIDTRPVEPDSITKSISKETTFSKDVSDIATLKRTIRKLSDGVGYRLRRKGFSGSTIRLKLRWQDFSTLSRQTTLVNITDDDEVIFAEALKLFEQTWIHGKPVRLIGVGIGGLQQRDTQLSLWDAETTLQNSQLQATLDNLRGRFGENAILRGSEMDIDED
jgi:DNA polymerase-4